MPLRSIFAISLLWLTATTVLTGQKAFRQYPAVEYDDFPLPSDWNQKAEWTRARLRYMDVIGRGSLRMSAFPGYWTMDYPRSDRHLLTGVRRLTRIDARSVEQVVDLDGSDDIYNWPVLYAVEVGHWVLSDDQARQLREFLLKGGFLMCDDFHGTAEWATFMASMSKVFPDRPVEEIDDSNPILHTVYDLQERFQVPGEQYLETGQTYEKDGVRAHWRAISDDKGRIMVAICHNMDLGDAWEHSDNPMYPEKFATLAYRIAINYFVYDLTH